MRPPLADRACENRVRTRTVSCEFRAVLQEISRVGPFARLGRMVANRFGGRSLPGDSGRTRRPRARPPGRRDRHRARRTGSEPGATASRPGCRIPACQLHRVRNFPRAHAERPRNATPNRLTPAPSAVTSPSGVSGTAGRAVRGRARTDGCRGVPIMAQGLRNHGHGRTEAAMHAERTATGSAGAGLRPLAGTARGSRESVPGQIERGRPGDAARRPGRSRAGIGLRSRVSQRRTCPGRFR